MDNHALAIEGGKFEMAQFIAAEGRGVEGGEDRPVFEVACVMENAGDFLHTQSGRQGGAALGAGDLVVEPLLLECGDIDEAECGSIE
jgi:hypothetical protein